MAQDETLEEAFGYDEARNMLAARITDAWRDMAGSTRRLLAEDPAEGRLLFYVLFSDLVFFLSWSLKSLVMPGLDATYLPIEIGFWLVFALFCRTSAMYLLSVLIGSVARILGGKGSWRDTRLAVFWGALVAAPIGFAAALGSALSPVISPLWPGGGPDWFGALLYGGSVMAFCWFVATALVEVHGFRDKA